ncbi:unnamed protein product, partial [Ectocarpus sp. 12 AP-2014]
MASAPGSSASLSKKQVCYRCDGCDDCPLQHVRHHCLVCADFDLCPRCYDRYHGPNSQFQGENAVMLGSHSTSHSMVALPVNSAQPASASVPAGAPQSSPRNSNPPPAATAEAEPRSAIVDRNNTGSRSVRIEGDNAEPEKGEEIEGEE